MGIGLWIMSVFLYIRTGMDELSLEALVKTTTGCVVLASGGIILVVIGAALGILSRIDSAVAKLTTTDTAPAPDSKS